MTLDVSQFAVIMASGAVTFITSVIGYQFRKHTLSQEQAAKRREAKQELHYKKLDAVIYALASASENINGTVFRQNYDAKMREYERESEMLNVD